MLDDLGRALLAANAELESVIQDVADLVEPMIRDGRMGLGGYASAVKNMLDKSTLVHAIIYANPYVVPAMLKHPRAGELRTMFLSKFDEKDEGSLSIGAATMVVLLVSEALKARGIDPKDLPADDLRHDEAA